MLENIKKLLGLSKSETNQDTTQILVNLKTITDDMLINNTGDAVMVMTLEPVPRELLSEKEQTLQATKIISELNSETLPYN